MIAVGPTRNGIGAGRGPGLLGAPGVAHRAVRPRTAGPARTRPALRARNDHGKRRYTVAQIAETFGVSRTTIYRRLDRDRP